VAGRRPGEGAGARREEEANTAPIPDELVTIAINAAHLTAIVTSLLGVGSPTQGACEATSGCLEIRGWEG
jgi:hypothetical protein